MFLTLWMCAYACVCDHMWEMERLGLFRITENLLERQIYSPITGFNTYQGSLETVCVNCASADMQNNKQYTRTHLHCHYIQVGIRGIKQLEKLPEAAREHS